MRRHFPPGRNERIISAARIVLGASSLFALWLDPSDPANYVTATYALNFAFLAYSVGTALIVWRRSYAGSLPIVTHVVDIAVFSALQYLTRGPSSPFFTYFVFSLFCGELRWGWRGTLTTAMVVVVLYMAMGVSMSGLGPPEFEVNRFIIRTIYLCVAAGLLVYLGQHEIRLRSEIERLARWPVAAGPDRREAVAGVLEHAARIMGATRAMVVWEAAEEPWLYRASWTASGSAMFKHGPDEFRPTVPPALTGATLVATARLTAEAPIMANVGDRAFVWRGLPVHPGLVEGIAGEATGFASAPFETERFSGRVFFAGLDATSLELSALTGLVAREIGASLDHIQLSEQLRELGASEQRIQVARDLHDGVLQSLTGIRLELQTIATDLGERAPLRDRLLALERALAIEQRELRMFIDDLKPQADASGSGGPLAARLRAMRERIALEWKVPVTLRVDAQASRLPDRLEQAVPLMVHEAVVNALKHGEPSRVSVDVTIAAETLHVVVADDGRGFPFRGRHGHDALARANAGPVSLRERASALGGEMTIDSTGNGSRVAIALPLATSPGA